MGMLSARGLFVIMKKDNNLFTNSMKKYSLIIVTILICLILSACSYNDGQYGVFLSYEGESERLSAYETVVIDAQYFDKEAIESFKKQGHEVYSYINIGSLETFRDYYDEYKDLTLDVYEHWEEERWIDVSSQRWQEFILESLAPALLDKGIDGFFVDNCDVYYQYPKAGIFEGLSIIMKGLKATGAEVVVNGGDAFLGAYSAGGGIVSDIITGINQESVFTAIDWDNGKFRASNSDDKDYFKDYIEKYSAEGIDIYLLEYTDDPFLAAQIKHYCNKHGFKYYISDSLELGI